ncbi:MAG: hypothetical protein DWQ36_01610 [Acidobacteria bacterium]|nr:MAG: hypothetical protein DWQ30_14400 [Acidobacteriota bacterium]REK11702.1 MAG: hypothetical protein DWQ36_01610 [Acidobacteriota bacterium]
MTKRKTFRQPSTDLKPHPQTGAPPRRRKRVRPGAVLGAFLLAMLVAATPALADDKDGSGLDAHARMQHLHVLLHEGLGLVLDGADLVMVANLGLDPSMDRKSSEHGDAVMKAGRELLEAAGGAIEGIGESGSERLAYTRELQRAFVAVAEHLEGMQAPKLSQEKDLGLHHMHLMTHHALRSAATGANLNMLASVDSSGEVDELSDRHGEWLLSNAKNTIARVLEGPSMQRLHDEGGYDTELMSLTHQLAQSADEAIELMLQMPERAEM